MAALAWSVRRTHTHTQTRHAHDLSSERTNPGQRSLAFRLSAPILQANTHISRRDAAVAAATAAARSLCRILRSHLSHPVARFIHNICDACIIHSSPGVCACCGPVGRSLCVCQTRKFSDAISHITIKLPGMTIFMVPSRAIMCNNSRIESGIWVRLHTPPSFRFA